MAENENAQGPPAGDGQGDAQPVQPVAVAQANPGPAMAILQLPPPQPFLVYTSLSDAHSRWTRWLRSFNMFVQASGVTTAAQQRQLLLYTAGEEIQAVVETHIAEHGDTLDQLSAAISTYVKGKQNVAFVRYEFRQLVQQQGESFDAWMSRLAAKAKQCDFGDPGRETAIRDQIIAGCNSEKLRRRLLQEADVQLAAAIRIA